MQLLKEEEMKRVEAGADTFVVAGIVAAIVAFLIGVFHGYSNPQECRN